MAKAARAANRNNAQNRTATANSEAEAKKQLQDIKTGGALGSGEQQEQQKEQKPKEEPQTGLALVPVDLNQEFIPDLDEATIVPLELGSSYWTPQDRGEFKRVYFDCIKNVDYQSTKPGEEDVVIPLLTAFFYESKNKEIKNFSNASKRLIGILENNHIERGTPVLITYLGKKKNTTNEFKSDDWSVKPLMLKIQETKK